MNWRRGTYEKISQSKGAHPFRLETQIKRSVKDKNDRANINRKPMKEGEGTAEIVILRPLRRK